MKHNVTVNTWPFSQKCQTCPFVGGLVQESTDVNQVTSYGSIAYVCTRSEDAETCKIPEALSIAKTTLVSIDQSQIASMLSSRRKSAAKKDCKQCKGSGEIPNLEIFTNPTALPHACICTKKA